MKPKTPIPQIPSRQDAEDCLGRLRSLAIIRRALNVRREQALKEIDEKHRPQLEDIETEANQLLDKIELWAESNPADFGATRSLQLTHGTVGFRTGQPALKLLTKWTWERVLAKLSGTWPGYVRTKEEVNKEAILAARNDLTPNQLTDWGLKVVQAETFYVEPKLD